MVRKKKNPLVSIIIVYYSGMDDLWEAVASVESSKERDFEIIVVNNSPHRLKFSNEKISIVENKGNIGFCRGCNLGAKLSRSRYIALLNPDAVVEPGWLGRLVNILQKDKKVGVAVGKIYRQVGKKKTKFFDSAGSLYNQIGSAWSRGFLEKDVGQYDKREEVPMATAGACVFRKKILEKTYLFDESFFMYMEEFDFCIRVRQLGYTIIYEPRAVSYHKFSRAVRGESVGKKEILFKQFYGNRARAKILAKYYPFSIILKNLHLIVASFLYWDFYFLANGGIGKFVNFKKNQISFALSGIDERRKYARKTNWVAWITHKGFLQLFGWHRETRQRESKMSKL